jgi:hypothetical protein
MLAAVTVVSVPVAAQAQQDQSILFIMRNDINLLQPSIYRPPFQIPGFRRAAAVAICDVGELRGLAGGRAE